MDRDWPEYNYQRGETGDFGSASYQMNADFSQTARSAVPGTVFGRTSLGFRRPPALMQGPAAPAQVPVTLGTFTESLVQVKWIALIGFAVWLYYKTREHKDDIKALGNRISSASRMNPVVSRENDRDRMKGYRYFVLDKNYEVLSGWENKNDAKEAFGDEPEAWDIVSKDSIAEAKLKTFIERNS